MARRTKQEAHATREQLLDAAEALFLSRGLGQTVLQDIALAAGVTRGAIYWHFADKVALVQALLERLDQPLEQALAEAEREEGGAPLTRLRSLALSPFALMRRDPRAKRVFAILQQRHEFTGELAPLAERHEDAMGSCSLRMNQLFATAQRAGQLRVGISPRQATLALQALLEGLIARAALSDKELAMRDLGVVVDALLLGLATDRSANPGAGKLNLLT